MPLWRTINSPRGAIALNSSSDGSESSSRSYSTSCSDTVEEVSRPVSPRGTVGVCTELAPQQTPAAPAAVRGPRSFATAGGVLPRYAPMVTGGVPLLLSGAWAVGPAPTTNGQSVAEARDHDGVVALAHRRVPSGALSVGGSGCSSFAFTTNVLKLRPTVNILVLGAPHVGKSLFINSYRAAVTNSTRWPTAPVGICGFYGTTTVEPFPNHPREPTWLCIDTPGRLYTTENEVLLERLVEGMPWKTRLLGPKALSLSQVEELVPIDANRADQCVVVVPATDLVEDNGWVSILLGRHRYSPAPQAASAVIYIKRLVSSLRGLMNDAPPYVVVSKMDKLGGADSPAACRAVSSLLGQCIPINRIFFSAFMEDLSSLSKGHTIELDSSTRNNLIQLHEAISQTVQWKDKVAAMRVA